MESITGFEKILSICISPIVLISGVGLLLLSVTNRLARTIDRSRILIRELQNEAVPHRDQKTKQVLILYRRSKILKFSVIAITTSIFCSSLIITLMLIMHLFAVNLSLIGLGLFFLSVIAIIVSVILLLIDVTLTLSALDHELELLIDS